MIALIYHLSPRGMIRWFDISLTNLLILERGYLKTHNLGVYVAGMLSMWLEPEGSQSWIVLRAIIMSLMGGLTFPYLYQWMICIFLYYCSLHYMLKNKMRMSSIACIFFHLCLGVLSQMEVGLYIDDEKEDPSRQFLRYCIYFFYVFYVVYAITDNPRRLRNVLSLLSCAVLCLMSFHQAWHQLRSPTEIYYDDRQTSMMLFYLAYVAVDMCLGYVYYRQYFTLLEGWTHHIGTGLITIHYLGRPVKSLYCMAMVIEASTILLCLFKIFYDVHWILYLRDEYFFRVFVFFRIILPTFFMVYFYHLMVDNTAILVYGVNTVLNLYWITRIAKKNN